MQSKLPAHVSKELKELYEKYITWRSMRKYVMNVSKKYGMIITQQEVYNEIFPNQYAAACGKEKRFVSFTEGYVFCGNKCACAKQSWKEKTRETNLIKYGTEYALQNHEVRKKGHDTNRFRYGAENPFQVPSFKEKIKKTNLGRYGVENPAQDNDIKNKAKITNLSRYGVEHAAQNSEFKEKMRDTNLSRYGSDHAMKNTKVRKKGRETNLARYGVENPFQNQDIKEKSRNTCVDKYGVPYFKQLHIPPRSLEILQDKTSLEEAFLGKSITTISSELEINPTTFSRYWYEHGLPSLSRPRSSYEDEIEAFLSGLGANFVTNDKTILKPRHLDFYLPDHKLAIEFNGLYWHSDIFKHRLYHREKYLGCRDKDIRLLMINEDEWNERSDVIRSRIRNILGLSERGVGARKLIISRLPNGDANSFFDQHHVQGRTGSIICAMGAWDRDTLVGAIAFNQQRNTQAIELVRYATDGKTYAGLFSRLLKRAIDEANFSEILSFADLRYSEGDLYRKSGFELVSEIPPDYRYSYRGRTWHKSSFTKKKINEKFGLDMSTMTERQAMKQLGIPRIYDCGKLKFKIMM